MMSPLSSKSTHHSKTDLTGQAVTAHRARDQHARDSAVGLLQGSCRRYTSSAASPDALLKLPQLRLEVAVPSLAVISAP